MFIVDDSIECTKLDTLQVDTIIPFLQKRKMKIREKILLILISKYIKNLMISYTSIAITLV